MKLILLGKNSYREKETNTELCQRQILLGVEHWLKKIQEISCEKKLGQYPTILTSLLVTNYIDNTSEDL